MTKINTQIQRGKSAKQRFDEKVAPAANGCWLWQSAIGSRGYGIFWVSKERRSVMAHRFAWELANGRQPDASKLVMHSCDNPACVNPAHLSLGTGFDNMRDAARKGRTAVGVRNGGGGKLNDDAVRQIRVLRKTTKISSLASMFDVHESIIKKVLKRQLWRHVA